ncbi:MAG TPA: hypothetical protein VK986_17900 [Tepidisphaeraceae bacterium]|nr:hypothetical protein [Tepidisphaeraceae bacterium]
MADSVENLERDLGRLSSRGEPTPAVQIRRSLRGKHVCPFCGTQRETDVGPCQHCSLEDTPTTRAATRSKLGPWYVLQSRNPSAPGMSFATLMMLVQKGRVTARSVLRGPTTGQFWRHAAKVKGVAREFGLCWNCGGDVSRNSRACPACKRMQEPPLNPDVLLEPGEISADELTEQMWAADAPSSQVGGAMPRSTPASPVERLMNKGGLRREVAPHAHDVDHSADEVRPANGNGHRNGNGNGHGHAHAPAARREESYAEPHPTPRRSTATSTDGDDLVNSLSGAIPADDGLDDLGPRRSAHRPAHGSGIPPRQGGARPGMLADASHELTTRDGLEMAVFQMPYGGRARGSVLGRLFKVLVVAVLIAGMGLGAMCYFDEGIRNKTVAYWEQFYAWAKSLTQNDRKPATATPPAPARADEDVADVEVKAPAPRSAVKPAPAAKVDPAAEESPTQRAYRLFEQASGLERRGDYAKAADVYEQIKGLNLPPQDVPIGVDARLGIARRKAAEQK